MEEENERVRDAKDIIETKHKDQAQQHKLNERKNVKNIKELKQQISRMKKETEAIAQEKVTLESDLETANNLRESAEAQGHRPRSQTAGSMGSQEYAAVGVESLSACQEEATPGSLEDINARMAMQLSETLLELDKKETMLQEYMRKMPTGGQTTLEMDLLKACALEPYPHCYHSPFLYYSLPHLRSSRRRRRPLLGVSETSLRPGKTWWHQRST